MGKQGRVIIKQQKAPQNPMAAAMKSMANMGDMPPLPDLPNKNMRFAWPPSAVKVMDWSRYFVIWPNNVDAGKTLKQGRRVSKETACSDPVAADLSEVCKHFQLWHILEPHKGYSREPYITGRIRVRLIDETGEVCNPEVPNKMALMKEMGRRIPGLESRKERIKNEKERLALAAKEEQKAQATLAANSSSKSGKKKGKKKGKK